MNFLIRNGILDELPPPAQFKSKYLRELTKDCFINAIDVGARGEFFNDLKPINDSVKGIGFEPAKSECEVLNKKTHKWDELTYVPRALGEQHGTKTIYNCEDGGKSSFLQPDKEFLTKFNREHPYQIKSTEEVPVTTLDDVANEQELQSTTFIKLDVQGYEDKILNGGHNFISNYVTGLRIEVSFHNSYQKQVSFYEINEKLDNLGFYLHDFTRMSKWSFDTGMPQFPFDRGSLVEGDALYFRKPENLAESNTLTEKDLLSHFLILACYGCYSTTKRVIDVINKLDEPLLDSTDTDILMSELTTESNKFKWHYVKELIKKATVRGFGSLL